MLKFKIAAAALIVILFLSFLWRGIMVPSQVMPTAIIDRPIPQVITAEISSDNANVLVVWSTWCPACRDGHDLLMQLTQEKQDDFRLVGLNYKDSVAAVDFWLDLHGNPYDVRVQDSGGMAVLDLGIKGVPEFFVVDKQGVIRYRHFGRMSEKLWNKKILPVILAINSST